MTHSRPALLWSLFILQVACTFFFVGDAVQDIFGAPEQTKEKGEVLEIAVAICLSLGTVFTGFELWRQKQREEKMRQQIGVASGALSNILQRQFDEWGLTEAEQDVAFLGIKGYSIEEIAGFRKTKEGTIKAQNASVYRKAGVSGRLQLLSHFIEDLLDENLIAPSSPSTSE